MGKLQNIITICVSLLFLLYGCAMASKLYPLPETGVKVKGNKIFHGDTLFAELRYLGDDTSAQGFSIFYHQFNKEIWIFPKEGFHIFLVKENEKYSTIPEIKEWLTQKAREKGYTIAVTTTHGEVHRFDPKSIRYTRGDRDVGEFKPMPSAFDIKISSDGKYVYYKTKGIFFDSSHKYLVEYGISK